MFATDRQAGPASLSGVRVNRMLIVVCAVFVGIAAFANAQAANVGWVVDVKTQSWHVNGGAKPLTKGAYLPSEGMLSNSAPSAGDYLVVANLHGDIIRRLRCTDRECGVCFQNDSCTTPISPLPKAPEQTGFVSAAFGGVMELFGEHPERYSIHRSRSIGHSCVSESIAQIDGGKAHLEGLLRNCEAGTYTLEFRSAGSMRGNSLGEEPKQVTVAWNPANPDETFRLDLKPGLYRVEYTRDWASGTAWLLLSGPPAYEKIADSFKGLAATVDGWGDDVEPETKIAYKRAYLDRLYESAESR